MGYVKKTPTQVPEKERTGGLRRARLAHGMRQDELAFLAGVSQRQIIRLENGQSPGTYLTWVRLSEALKVPIENIRYGNIPTAAWEKLQAQAWPAPADPEDTEKALRAELEKVYARNTELRAQVSDLTTRLADAEYHISTIAEGAADMVAKTLAQPTTKED